jgi:PKD repeat protein
VTTNFGCNATTQKPITIVPSPTASFTHNPACVSTGTQFTDASSGSIKSWLWKIDNTTYTFNNPLQVFSAQGTYNAQLTVTDNNNCVAQMTQTIIVPFTQFPDFSAKSTCATKPAVFQDTTPISMDPVTSVTWIFGGQGSGSGSPAQVTFPATGNFSVKMNARAQSGCVYSVTKTIAIVSPPVAGFTTSTDAGPVPLQVQFTNTSTNASGYVWHFHDNTNWTSTVPSPSFTFNELGQYIVDLDATSVQGCLDTFSKIISVVIPRVDAGLTGLQFIRDAVSGEYRAMFVIDNAGNMPLTDPTILVEISGNIALKEILNLTVLPGHRTSQILNFSLLPGGLDYVCLSAEVAQDVSLYNNKQCASLKDETITFAPYPNPVNGELHLDWIAAASGTAQLTVFSSTGAKAFDRSVEAPAAGLNQIRLDVSNLSPGMYLIVFNYSGQKKTFRFAVQ